jgi:hypothetical protein
MMNKLSTTSLKKFRDQVATEVMARRLRALPKADLDKLFNLADKLLNTRNAPVDSSPDLNDILKPGNDLDLDSIEIKED